MMRNSDDTIERLLELRRLLNEDFTLYEKIIFYDRYREKIITDKKSAKKAIASINTMLRQCRQAYQGRWQLPRLIIKS